MGKAAVLVKGSGLEFVASPPQPPRKPVPATPVPTVVRGSAKRPRKTKDGHRITWTVRTPRVCKVVNGKVVAKSAPGVWCRLVASASAGPHSLSLKQQFNIKIRAKARRR